MQKVTLKKNRDKRLKAGHLWVFSNELIDVPPLQPGEIVELENIKGDSYGIGFFNPNSLISVRLLLSNQEPDKKFFAGRISKAYELRKGLFPHEQTYRLVFGESDLLPGLIIDRYENYMTLQILSAGMEIRRNDIIDSLLSVIPETKGIIEKNRTLLRELEGLPQREGIIFGNVPDEIMTQESGIKLLISLREGQKTGYYLDQRDNRLFIRRISKGKTVLDCFTYQGGFALNAASAGAEKATGIDSSENAVSRARKNAEINSLNNVAFEEADVFEFLQGEANRKRKYDVIILDPPAFAKNKKSVPAAKAGYARLNRLAMQLLPDGGFLASSSCSQHLREDVFHEIISKEASGLKRKLRLIYRGMQAPDHPILAGMPETRYLKFFVFQVL